jgi:hypothetical protein
VGEEAFEEEGEEENAKKEYEANDVERGSGHVRGPSPDVASARSSGATRNGRSDAGMDDRGEDV